MFYLDNSQSGRRIATLITLIKLLLTNHITLIERRLMCRKSKLIKWGYAIAVDLTNSNDANWLYEFI